MCVPPTARHPGAMDPKARARRGLDILIQRGLLEDVLFDGVVRNGKIHVSDPNGIYGTRCRYGRGRSGPSGPVEVLSSTELCDVCSPVLETAGGWRSVGSLADAALSLAEAEAWVARPDSYARSEAAHEVLVAVEAVRTEGAPFLEQWHQHVLGDVRAHVEELARARAEHVLAWCEDLGLAVDQEGWVLAVLDHWVAAERPLLSHVTKNVYAAEGSLVHLPAWAAGALGREARVVAPLDQEECDIFEAVTVLVSGGMPVLPALEVARAL